MPDNYEVLDASLNDIKYNLQPIFNQQLILKLDSQKWDALSLEGNSFSPGCVGLNNLKLTDYANCVIQLLCRVKDLRDFSLVDESVSKSTLTTSVS